MRSSSRSGLFTLLVASAVLIALAGARGQNQSSLEPRTFKPPRIAVLEVSRLFANYNKKKDVEKKLQAEMKEEEERFRELKTQQRQTVEELKNLQSGTPRHRELTIRSREQEYDLKTMEDELYKKFLKRKFDSLKEINIELSKDIGKLATALELDLVLEKTVLAEAEGGASFHWPVVHYARPEIDITDELITRLNLQYGPSRVVPGK